MCTISSGRDPVNVPSSMFCAPTQSMTGRCAALFEHCKTSVLSIASIGLHTGGHPKIGICSAILSG